MQKSLGPVLGNGSAIGVRPKAPRCESQACSLLYERHGDGGLLDMDVGPHLDGKGKQVGWPANRDFFDHLGAAWHPCGQGGPNQ